MNCCAEILNLGLVNTCVGALPTGLTATETGVYKLQVDYLGRLLIIEQPFNIGEPLVFDVRKLNEDFEYLAKVFLPSGGQLTKAVTGTQYECFSFSTFFEMGAGPGGEAPTPCVFTGSTITPGDCYEDFVFNEVPQGGVNGSNAVFMSAYDFVPESVEVFINGLLQKPIIHFNTSGNQTILFTESPNSGDQILINYIKI